MFCEACASIFSGRAKFPRLLLYGGGPPLYDKEYAFHPTGAQFKQAVDDRCHSCYLLWGQLTADERIILSGYPEQIFFEFKLVENDSRWGLHGLNNYTELSLSGPPITTRPRLIFYHPITSPEIPVIEGNTASERSFQFASTECATRPAGSRTPSWSWATVDGAVNFLHWQDIGVRIAKVVQADTETHNQRNCVEESGKVKIHGCLRKFKFDNLKSGRLQDNTLDWEETEAALVRFDDKEASMADFYCLPLASRIEYFGRKTKFFGLLLNLSKPGYTEFSRVGYFEYLVTSDRSREGDENEKGTKHWKQQWEDRLFGEVPHIKDMQKVQDTEPATFEITIV